MRGDVSQPTEWNPLLNYSLLKPTVGFRAGADPCTQWPDRLRCRLQEVWLLLAMLGLVIAEAAGASGCVGGGCGAVGVVGFGGGHWSQYWDLSAHAFAS